MLAAQIGRLHPGLVLLQDRNDLLFRVPLAFHRLVLSQGQTPFHPGSIQRGNVKGYDSFMGAAQEQATAATAGVRDLGQKVLTFTERNISATLQFGQRLLQAKDLSEVTRLQSEYLSAQTRAVGTQQTI